METNINDVPIKTRYMIPTTILFIFNTIQSCRNSTGLVIFYFPILISFVINTIFSDDEDDFCCLLLMIEFADVVAPVTNFLLLSVAAKICCWCCTTAAKRYDERIGLWA